MNTFLTTICVLSIGVLSACSADEKTIATLDDSSELMVSTTIGKWAVEPSQLSEIQRVKQSDLPKNIGLSGDSDVLNFDKAFFEMPKITPIIETREDFEIFLLGSSNSYAINAIMDDPLYQIVEGVPDVPRYSDPKFDFVRNSFSPECLQAAQAYLSDIKNIDQSSNFTSALKDTFDGPDSNYDKECLVNYADPRIPNEIREVTGILMAVDSQTNISKPFCSATIVGEHDILTSRHCFFSLTTGKRNTASKYLDNKQVEFVTLAPHHGQSIFSVNWHPSTNFSETLYAPNADQMKLKIIFGAMQNFASQTPPTRTVPHGVWLLGHNALLNDIYGGYKHPLDFVRGSAPLQCSIIEYTEKGCIYHTCQSGKGVSGGGLLSIDPQTQQVSVLGVHRGAMTVSTGCESHAPTSLQMNVGATILP